MVRKIHQIWYQGENIPDTFRIYSEKWKKTNPEFKHAVAQPKLSTPS